MMVLMLSNEKSCDEELWLLDCANSFRAAPPNECFSLYIEGDFSLTYMGHDMVYPDPWTL